MYNCMYDCFESEDFAFHELVRLIEKYNHAPLYIKDDGIDKMSIIFSVACKNGIVLACDSKIKCFKENDYVPVGEHYSDKKIWRSNSLAAVCCGNLDFVNSDGYSLWKEVMESAVSESKYDSLHDLRYLLDILVRAIQKERLYNTQMIIADATQRKISFINDSEKAIYEIDRCQQPFIKVFGYYPIRSNVFFNNIANEINNYNLEELRRAAADYIRLNISAADFIAQKVPGKANETSQIGGEIHLLSLHNDGFIEYHTME